MNEIVLLEIESIAPVALGILFMYIFMKLKFGKNVVRVYMDSKGTAKDSHGLHDLPIVAQKQIGARSIRMSGMDELEKLHTVYRYAGILRDSSYWGNYICLNQNFRSCLISDMIYDELVVSGRLAIETDNKGIIEEGACSLGILDLKDVGNAYRLIGRPLCQAGNLTGVFLESSEMISEIAKYSKNSGLILLLLQNSDVSMEGIQ